MRQGLALLAVLLVATAARAVDVPVSYSVDFRAYKSGVTAGAPLTFALYADSGCTTLLHSQVLNAGSAVRQEKIFAQAVNGQTPRPPKEMRLRATLSPSTPAESVFLLVTGAGIVPIAPACQPQAAGIPSAQDALLSVRNGMGDVIGQTFTPTATCGVSSCSLPFTRTVGTGIRLDCSLTESSNGMTTLSCSPIGVNGWPGLYADAGCTQPVLEWNPPTVYSPANLPPDPTPVVTAAATVIGGKVYYSEAPMSAYASMPVFFFLNPCIAAGTHVVITPQVFDLAPLNVPPFTVGP